MVKDRIMKIKKSKADFHDLSSKKAINGEKVDGQKPTNGIKIEDKKEKQHKKHKKEKRKLNEGEQPLKKDNTISINDQTTLSNVPPANAKTPDLPEKDVANSQGHDSSHSGTKETLMVRLRTASTHINSIFSVLHIPKHKNADADGSEEDEVADITPEVRRQMRLKVQTQMKSQPRSHNRVELQERLRLKLEELRGTDKKNPNGKSKKKLTKAEKKAKAKQEHKLKAKLAKGDNKGNSLKIPGGTKPAKPVFNNDGKMVFSKFDFSNGECAIGGGSTKKPVLDPKAALGKIQKHKEKIQSLQAIGKTERAKNIEEKATWKAVMERTEGVKVKDDEGLLKKTIKRIDQKKKSSKKKWDARVEGEESRKKMKQEKRTENIKKRKQDTKQNKLKKASKKGRSVPGFR